MEHSPEHDRKLLAKGVRDLLDEEIKRPSQTSLLQEARERLQEVLGEDGDFRSLNSISPGLKAKIEDFLKRSEVSDAQR